MPTCFQTLKQVNQLRDLLDWIESKTENYRGSLETALEIQKIYRLQGSITALNTLKKLIQQESGTSD